MKITSIHYKGITVSFDPPLKEEQFLTARFRIDPRLLDPIKQTVLLEYLSGKLVKGAYNPPDTHGRRHPPDLLLRVEIEGGKRVLWVNGHGCAKEGEEEYYLYPRAFVEAIFILEELRARSKAGQGKSAVG